MHESIATAKKMHNRCRNLALVIAEFQPIKKASLKLNSSPPHCINAALKTATSHSFGEMP